LCFENGVKSVQSELDDGACFDLLPSPSVYGNSFDSSFTLRNEKNLQRFHYGSNTLLHPSSSQSVDQDIDKLREIIGSVHNTLSRCSVVSLRIREARREKDSFHLNIVRGLDSWIALRGYELMSERTLLNGVSSLEACRETVEKSDVSLNDNLAWQASLASCAVSATEDVRSAVRASRTASGAKAAAESAALSAQKSFENFSSQSAVSPEDIRIARTRASISHSHAIYAVVIEHEAFCAKRKAALAVAHDVKFWNLHRKREALKMCIDAAESQRNAAKKSSEAWSLLLEGLFGPTFTEASETHSTVNSIYHNRPIIDDVIPPTTLISCPKLIPVDHVALTPKNSAIDIASSSSPLKKPDNTLSPTCQLKKSNDSLTRQNQSSTLMSDSVSLDNYFVESSPRLTEQHSSQQQENEMTASMQSLVDGLMTWGLAQGNYDPQDDMSLPTGMALQLLEESGVTK